MGRGSTDPRRHLCQNAQGAPALKLLLLLAFNLHMHCLQNLTPLLHIERIVRNIEAALSGLAADPVSDLQVTRWSYVKCPHLQTFEQANICTMCAEGPCTVHGANS